MIDWLEASKSNGRQSASTLPTHEQNGLRILVNVGFKHNGVVPASEDREILVALASLIRAQRYDMALTILANELGGGC